MRSSMLVNRSTMAVSRAVILANLSSVRPQPSCLVLCTIAFEAQDAFAFGVPP